MRNILLKIFLIITAIIWLCPAVIAQSGYTTVTAVVADSNGTLFVNSPFTVSFFDPGTSGKLPRLNNSTFQTSYVGYSTDSSGRLSISLPDNSIIASSSGATGTGWIFSICTATGTYTTRYCIPNITITISGASQNISAALTAVAPILPQPSTVQLQTNGVPNATQSTLNLKNGSNVTIASDSMGGVTINSSGGNSGSLSSDNTWTNNNRFAGTDPYADITAFGARALAVIPTTTASCNGTTTITVASNPGFIIGDGFTVRGCGTTNPLTTPLAPTVVPSEAGAGQGMGYNTQTRTGSAASSTYAYSVVARDKYGALTAASPTTTIVNGPATLGGITYTISSISRSGNTVTVVTTGNNLASIGGGPTTAGTMACVSVTPGQQFDGCFTVAQVDSPTQFEFQNTPIDTHGQGYYAGDSTTASSGSVTIFVDNLITWTPVTGAWEYYIYSKRPGDSAQNLIGVTQPSGISNGVTDTAFEDYGSPFLDSQIFQSYVPVTPPPSVATNDPLTTIITNISGTTFTVANTASQTTSGQTAVYDAAPNMLTAANSISYFSSGGGPNALRGGAIYIPQATAGCNQSCAFIVNSYLELPQNLTVWQSGPIWANETIAVKSNVNWNGIWGQSGVPQFGYTGSATVRSLTANPLLYVYGTGALFQNLEMYDNNTNGGVLVVEDNDSPSTWENVSMDVNEAGNSSYWGRDLILRETNGTISNHYYNKMFFGGGPSQVPNSSWTPLVYFDGFGAGVDGLSIAINTVQIGRRSFAISQTGGGSGLSINGCYRQGGIAPVVLSFSTGGSVGLTLGCSQDTETEPAVTNLANAGTLRQTLNLSYSGGGGAGDPFVSGILPLSYNGNTLFNGRQTAPSRSSLFSGNANTVVPPYNTGAVGPCGVSYCPLLEPFTVYNQLISFGDGHSLIWPLAGATSLAVSSIGAGGSVPVGTWTYAIIEIGSDGGFTIPSVPITATTTGGNQTVNLTWTPAPGTSQQAIYRCSGTCIVSGQANVAAGWFGLAGPIAATITSYADTAASPPVAFLPNVTGAGITTINRNGFSGLRSQLIPGVFSLLPTCNAVAEGSTGSVLDSMTAAWGATITGGGANHVKAYCDGTNWTVAAK